MPENENPRFLYFSTLIGKRVTAADGTELGRLADLVVATGEPYPPIESLVVRQGGKLLQFPWSSVKAANGTVQIDTGVEPTPLPEAAGPDRIRLAEEILDRQIVDVKGAKLVRVNDLHILEVKGTLRLAHVDVSLRGLVRRLGWERIVDWTITLLRPQAPYLKAEHLLSWKLVQPIDRSPGRVRIEVAQQMLATLHPADLAEIIEELDRHQRELLFKRLDVETAAEALEEASEQVATELLEAVPPERAADILEEMAPDEAADALAKLPGDTRDELLSAMERPEAAEVQELLEYRPRSAGGLMTPDLVEVRPEATVADALAEVRRRAEELRLIYEVFVTDPDRQLKGLCTLKDLVAADPGVVLSKILHEAPATVSAKASLREVAGAAAKYNLLSVPVIDQAGALLGMVTVDDILAEVVHAR